MENTKNIFEQLEVLAPAGNAECFNAALSNGADAIYLGLSDFNARMKAQNFTTENIREYVALAHSFGVKIYVTINTLLEDRDFDALLEMVKKLTEAKVDAYIIQDLGVAHILKNAFDGIILHASTQMGIHNLQGAKIAEKLGFSRIVLSRETKLEDIKQIKQNTNLEIEYFVQGALCVAFSGNCYLSAMENNMSGNEGRCLQLCRLPYTNNLNGKTSYALSTRDLSLLDNLKELIDAGVTSFKIEGRLRHAGYVATCTNIYKNAIELIKNNKMNDKFKKLSEKALRTTYSRGEFNKNAYLKPTKQNNIIYSDYQNHIGIKIGKVKSVMPFKNDLFKVTIESNEPLHSGDGLKIINPKTKEQVSSLGIGNIDKLSSTTYVIYTKNKFSAGLDVLLTQNSEAEQSLLQNTQKIKINIKLIAKSGEPLKVFAENKFTSIYFESEELLEPSKTYPLFEKDFKDQFEKLGDSIFELENFKVKTNDVFAPKSLLNKSRRKMVELLTEKTVAETEKHLSVNFNEKSLQNVKNQNIITKPYNLIKIDNENFEVQPNTIYVYSPSDYTSCNPQKIIQKTKPENFAIELPTIMSASDFAVFENVLNKLPKNIYIYANNIGGLSYTERGYSVIASPLLNIRNNYALKCLNWLGIQTICASIEARTEFAEENNLVFFESGDFPFMTFAHCPYKAILDSSCDKCKHDGKLTYTSSAKTTYKIKRTKLANCYFALNKTLSLGKSNYNLTNFVH